MAVGFPHLVAALYQSMYFPLYPCSFGMKYTYTPLSRIQTAVRMHRSLLWSQGLCNDGRLAGMPGSAAHLPSYDSVPILAPLPTSISPLGA